MANTLINTPDLLDLGSATGATILPKGGTGDRPTSSVTNVNIDFLVVAGGGGLGDYGSAYYGGGGGSGGFRTSISSDGNGGGQTADSAIVVNGGTNYTITIGNGGVGNDSSGRGNDGLDSVFATITAKGGGGGGQYDATGSGKDGGSGGGAGGNDQANSGGAALTSPTIMGYAGGNISTGVSQAGAGGGGAGSVGQDGGQGASSSVGGNGGDAKASTITGTTIYYAAGGGGTQGYYGTPAHGAAGTNATGAANSGDGGMVGATNGRNGIVILRYPNNINISIGAGLNTGVLNGAVSGSTDKYTTFIAGTGTVSFTSSTTDGTFRFNTDTNLTEFYNGDDWEEVTDQYASGYDGIPSNYFDTKLFTSNASSQIIGGYINGSASFNGSSSKIDLGNNSSNNTATFSVSLWFKTAGHSATAALINNGGSNSGETGYYLGLNSNGTIKFEAGTGTVNGAVNYADSNWHQIVLTLNSGAYNIYVDGNTTPVITGSGAFTTTATRPTWIGQFSYTSSNIEFFEGSIDQVRLYNTALSASDVAALNLETAVTATTAAFPSGQTAIATYTMDTSANGLLTTTDLSTVNYPSGAGCIALYEMNNTTNDTSGTYNATSSNISYQGGAFDQAAAFNGSSSEITASSFASLSQVGISMWVNIPDVTAAYGLINRYGTNREFGIYNYTGTNGFVASLYYNGNNGNAIEITASDYMTNNTWHHIAYTADGSTQPKLYIDGVSVGTPQSNNNTYYTSSEPLKIGHGLGGYFSGQIDQVRIFDTALSASDVTTLARGIATSYSGSNTDVNFNGYLDFQTDLIIGKTRQDVASWDVYDSVRGGNKYLGTNLANAEATGDYIISFDANGFSLGTATNFNYYNDKQSVAYCWKAGGTAVTNNDGTISSSVSANKDSGFSIVKYVGNGISGATVGHGLGSKPQFIVFKNLDTVVSWIAYDTINNVIGYLDSTDSLTDGRRAWAVNNTDPTNTLVTLGNNQATNAASDFIMYCWHSVAGYSKIGSYSGSGVSGKEVTLDFSPGFVLIKRINAAAGWVIVDDKRGTKELFPNVSNAEDTTATNIVLGTNKFTLNSTGSWYNASGGTYLYMAIA